MREKLNKLKNIKAIRIIYKIISFISIIFTIIMIILLTVGSCSYNKDSKDNKVTNLATTPIKCIVQVFGEYRGFTFDDFNDSLKLKSIVSRLYDLTNKQQGDNLNYQANVSSSSCLVSYVKFLNDNSYDFPLTFSRSANNWNTGLTNVNFYITDLSGFDHFKRLDIDFYNGNDIYYRFRIEYNYETITGNGGNLGYYTIEPFEIVDSQYFAYSPNIQGISIFEHEFLLMLQYSGAYNLYEILTYAYNQDTEAYQNGLDAGYLNGYSSGYDIGYDNGRIDGINDGQIIGYNSGYGVGYDIGYQDGYNGENNIFTMVKEGFTAVASLLNIQLLPNITLGLLLFTPLVVVIIIAIVKMIKG